MVAGFGGFMKVNLVNGKTCLPVLLLRQTGGENFHAGYFIR
jgi:hypothetical protein|tara:strand:+ start:878 stop:1000 length:123 start_codon:yes stop_codon:yes gene_type:complete